MTQGLVCIALAAAHLEAQQQKESEMMILQPSEKGLHTSLPARSHISEAPRLISNGADESDEDPITNPEETLAKILEEQPKETPPAPTAEDVITSVLPDDVLCGRGGETNHHPGNVQYRGLVKKYQRLYLKAKRRDKPKIARLIVDTVRRRTGRFLKKDPVAGVWKDVGNNKAREKTSQALREGAPEIRDTDTKRKSIGGSVVTPNTSTGSLPIDEAATPKSYANYEIMPATKKFKTAEAPTYQAPTYNAPPATTQATTENFAVDATTEDPKSTGGPRLKFLKSRLMSNESLLEETTSTTV
jgi:hypothetical protein